MNATEILVILILLRLVVPFGLLLWVGESVQRRQLTHLHRI